MEHPYLKRAALLQLFSDGEAAGADTGETAAPDAGEQTPETFEALIRGRYRKDFERRVQGILSERLKSHRASEERLRRFEPVLTRLAEKYGLPTGDAGAPDPDALEQALSSEQTAEDQRVATVHARYERAERQAEQARALYPGFELSREMENPVFAGLLAADVDAQTAYEVVHKDEILLGGMRYAAEQAGAQVAEAIRCGALRPVENGVGAPGAASVQTEDPRALTHAQRVALRERVRRGEQIVW